MVSSAAHEGEELPGEEEWWLWAWLESGMPTGLRKDDRWREVVAVVVVLEWVVVVVWLVVEVECVPPTRAS